MAAVEVPWAYDKPGLKTHSWTGMTQPDEP